MLITGQYQWGNFKYYTGTDFFVQTGKWWSRRASRTATLWYPLRPSLRYSLSTIPCVHHNVFCSALYHSIHLTVWHPLSCIAIFIAACPLVSILAYRVGETPSSKHMLHKQPQQLRQSNSFYSGARHSFWPDG